MTRAGVAESGGRGARRAKLRVLFVSHGSGLGGAERVMLETIEGLDREAFSPSVVVPDEGPLASAARGLGLRTHVVPAEWWLGVAARTSPAHFRYFLEMWPRFADPIVRIIREHKIDLVYSCSSPILHGALAAMVARVPHLHHMQDLLGSPYMTLRMPAGGARRAYRILGLLSSLVVCVGQTVRDDIGTAIRRDRCRVVLLGSRETLPGGRRMHLPGGEPGAVRVGIVGAVDVGKGVRVMPAVVQQACAAAPELHFYWAGPGPDHVIAEAAAGSRVNGASRLHFLGYTEDIPAFLSSVDFVLHPSRMEAMPRAVLESARQGRAVVATRCGGTGELVEDGVTGFLTPVDDAQRLAEAVVRLAREPGLRDRMGAAARRFADRFGLARFQAEMRDALIDAHARGPVPRNPMIAAVVTGALRLPRAVLPTLRRIGVHRAARGLHLGRPG